jgi:O-antigen/teichoic acid export membrane protein
MDEIDNSYALCEASHTAPDLILVKMFGMHLLAIFNRGAGLLNMVSDLLLGGLRPVLLPYLSKKYHASEAELAAAYIKMTDVLLGLLWPVLGFIVVYAETIIVFLFGGNWIEATPVVQILSAGGAFVYIAALSDELFKATGRVKLLASLSTVFACIRVAAILIGTIYGMQMVLFMIVLIGILQTVVKLHFIRKVIPFAIVDIVSIAGKNFTMVVLVTGPCWFASMYMPPSNFLTLLYAGLLFLTLWGACLLLFHRSFVFEMLDRGRKV